MVEYLVDNAHIKLYTFKALPNYPLAGLTVAITLFNMHGQFLHQYNLQNKKFVTKCLFET